MQHSISDNEFQSKRMNYITVFENMLKENPNHWSIKQQVFKITQKIEVLTYSGLIESQDKYIEKFGMFLQDEDLFAYIGKLLNDKQKTFLHEYDQGLVTIKSNIKSPPEPQPEPPQQIVKQVEYVLSNIDLPLSLFKRNDKYWSIDNPKTKQAQQYLKKLREQDQKFKLQMKRKRQEIMKEKEEVQSKTMEAMKKQLQNYKKQLQEKINRKVDQLKRNQQNRKRTISQSVQFIKQRGVPLFKKIEKQFKQKVEIPSLEQKKRKLAELRQAVRSVPLQQIQEHRQRYQKQKSSREYRKIFNEPLNISFKSHFYEQVKTMSGSRLNQMQSNLSLYQKRLEYSRLVKENHRPAIDELKKEEIQSRIKLMNKRRARVKKTKKQQKQSDEQQQEEQEPQQQEQEEQPEDDEQDDDQDDQKPEKDDQYEPSNKERYKMGLNYLKVARKLAAKRQDSENKTSKQQIPTAKQSKTISFQNPKDVKDGQLTVQIKPEKKKYVWLSKYDEEQKKQGRIQYKNYLRQMNKDQSTDLMDTTRIKKQIEKSIETSNSRLKARSRYEQTRKDLDIQAEIMYQTNLQNKIRNIEERAKNQEELLKFKRINRSEKIKKKMAIDDAVIDTIKARLSMMNKTLDV